MVSRGPYDSKSGAGLEPRTLGERLKKLRWQFGWTQEDLSRAVNTDQAIISNWERDKAKPSGAALAALAQVFRTSPQALESGEGFELTAPKEGLADGKVELSLSPAQGAPVKVVDLQSGQEREAEFQEALALLLKGTQSGRSVWVVLK